MAVKVWYRVHGSLLLKGGRFVHHEVVVQAASEEGAKLRARELVGTTFTPKRVEPWEAA